MVERVQIVAKSKDAFAGKDAKDVALVLREFCPYC
jgi:hypothetical protein